MQDIAECNVTTLSLKIVQVSHHRSLSSNSNDRNDGDLQKKKSLSNVFSSS